MTLANEVDLVEGHKRLTGDIRRLCIPSVAMDDGPNGLADGLTGVTELPAGVSLAATFDPVLAKRYGQVIGAEAAGKGIAGTLGPSVDIVRDPRWGRAFETYGEDPYLNATLVTGDIEGLQSHRVMAEVKHFDAYSQETYRVTPADDAIVSDRALHEIYMPAFQAAVQAKAAGVLCGNNLVNGHYDCQNHYLLTNVLKQEWDFPGFVIADHRGMHSTIGAAFGGTHLERGYHTYYGRRLESDVRSGRVPRAILNTMVQRILTELFRFNLIDKTTHGIAFPARVTTPGHVAFSNEVAEAGTTLLKNAGHTLPLAAGKAGKVAVIGSGASASPAYAGAGSGYVIPPSR